MCKTEMSGPGSERILVLEGPLNQRLDSFLAQQSSLPIQKVDDAHRLLTEIEKGAALVVLDVLALGSDPHFYQRLERSLQSPVLLVLPAIKSKYSVTVVRVPFDRETVQDLEELLAGAQRGAIRVGHLVVDLRAWQVMLRGRSLSLSATELRLLVHLAHRLGRVVTYEDLLEEVWGYDPAEGSRDVVMSSVKRLRKRLKSVDPLSSYIINVPGVGYRLCSQEEWEQAVTKRR
jgi:DNA-binding response OmpR family regulator